MKQELTYTAPCNFGIESLLKREIESCGGRIIKTDDGRIDFAGDWQLLADANIRLRTAERILLKVGEFAAYSFEDLYQGVFAIDWAAYLPRDAAFPAAKAASRKSKLFSVSDIQAITKKAVVDKLFSQYKVKHLPETGATIPINIFINKDTVNIYLDTSGDPLFKRGYRRGTNEAPIKETLAAALVLLAPWRKDELTFADPLCGSGTIVIEAAQQALGIAPGLNRSFLAESWPCVPSDIWIDGRASAGAMRRSFPELTLYAADIDAKVLDLARENARRAGVDQVICFQRVDARSSIPSGDIGVLVCNPPYGERMADKNVARQLYTGLGKSWQRLSQWYLGIITADEQFERFFGRRADKKRKVYNGMLKCNYYQYNLPHLKK